MFAVEEELEADAAAEEGGANEDETRDAILDEFLYYTGERY
jgi:hypothetical protein